MTTPQSLVKAQAGIHPSSHLSGGEEIGQEQAELQMCTAGTYGVELLRVRCRELCHIPSPAVLRRSAYTQQGWWLDEWPCKQA